MHLILSTKQSDETTGWFFVCFMAGVLCVWVYVVGFHHPDHRHHMRDHCWLLLFAQR